MVIEIDSSVCYCSKSSTENPAVNNKVCLSRTGQGRVRKPKGLLQMGRTVTAKL